MPSRTRTRTLAVTGPEPSSPTKGRSLAFDEEFNAPIAFGTRWNGSSTSAYRYGDHDPDDAKLDWLTPSAITVSGGTATFTATPSSHTLENGRQAWNTGLLTTEGTTKNFRTRTGDYAEARVQLPSVGGAWPAVWTWFDGGNEVDGFEYHPDTPHILEFVNHVNLASILYTDPGIVHPGAWITVGVNYGATDDDWYLNGKLIYSDHTGVGTTWSPNITLNLSVTDGTYHPTPSTTTTRITFKADYVRVWR
ncbi:beta-glucanase [Streptomyces sp. IMTB 2501]|nr:beta-glucanase [Streptomyces sp. IMTB 2501]